MAIQKNARHVKSMYFLWNILTLRPGFRLGHLLFDLHQTSTHPKASPNIMAPFRATAPASP